MPSRPPLLGAHKLQRRTSRTARWARVGHCGRSADSGCAPPRVAGSARRGGGAGSVRRPALSSLERNAATLSPEVCVLVIKPPHLNRLRRNSGFNAGLNPCQAILIPVQLHGYSSCSSSWSCRRGWQRIPIFSRYYPRHSLYKGR